MRSWRRLPHTTTPCCRGPSSGVDPHVALVGINDTAKEKPGSSPLPPMAGQSLKAGDIPRHGGNPAEFAGTAVFRRDRLAGTLTIDETSALLALRGEMGKVYASVSDPREEGLQLTLRFHQENKPKYVATFNGTRPRVHVILQFEAELLSAPGRTDYSQPENRRRLEQHISKSYMEPLITSLVRKLCNEWGADPVGFGQLYRSRFASFPAWVSYRWEDHVRDLQVTVETDVFIRRFGMILSGELAPEKGE